MGNDIKKSLKLSAIIAIIFNAVCFLINLICAYTINVLPLGVESSGGDVIEYTGFGVSLLKIFSNSPSSEVTYNVSFNINSLSIMLIFCFIISFIIIFVINIIKNKKH